MPGTPPTSPNFNIPRIIDTDLARYATDLNAITDGFDAQAARRGVIVDADIAPNATIVKSKLAPLQIVDADVSPTAAIAQAKLNIAVDAPAGSASLRTLGSGAQQAAAGNDSRLSDSRVPTPHAATHRSGGSDYLQGVPPVGAQMPYTGNGDPTDGVGEWVIADGRLIDRTTYATFFNKTGHTYNGGVDPGNNKVKIPDKRGKKSMGAINMGTGAGVNDNAHAQLARGASGGEVLHTLLAAESGTNDNSSMGTDSVNHYHGFSATSGTVSAWHAHNVAGSTGGQSANHSHTAHAAGGGRQIPYTSSSANTGISAGVMGSGGEYGPTSGSYGGWGANTDTGAASNDHAHSFNVNSGNPNANHTHAVSGNSGTVSAFHTHDIAARNADSGHNNLDPYECDAWIVRIA